MNTCKRLIAGGSVVLTTLVILVLAVGLTQAQEPGPEGDIETQANTSVMAAVYDRIPVQGKLTDENGNPLPIADYDITFRLYENYVGGTPICTNTQSVGVVDGLFSTYINGCGSKLNGQMVWLSVEVNGDGEMTDRQAIYPVPYAFSLRPGAVISDTRTSAVLNVFNHGNGWGLDAYSEGHDAVHGRSDASNHAGVSGNNTGGGVGVYGYSDTGIAIQAAGTGVIQSTAQSYIWISGNGARPYHQSDSTIIDMSTVGGAVVRRGATAGSKNIMLPITVPGPLYGQNVRISDLDIYWKGQTEFDVISAVILRRQTGVCSSSSCYASIVHDVGGAGYTCEDGVVPEGGCKVHYDLTTNNVLNASSGILYLTIGLTFNSDSSWIEIGGVQLTLEHD